MQRERSEAEQQVAGLLRTARRKLDLSVAFLSRIDGLLYEDDPRQGVIEGNTFIHPDMRLTFTVPNGYYMVNGTRAVSINGQRGQAQLTTAAYNGDEWLPRVKPLAKS